MKQSDPEKGAHKFEARHQPGLKLCLRAIPQERSNEWRPGGATQAGRAIVEEPSGAMEPWCWAGARRQGSQGPRGPWASRTRTPAVVAAAALA